MSGGAILFNIVYRQSQEVFGVLIGSIRPSGAGVPKPIGSIEPIVAVGLWYQAKWCQCL